jgi:aryl-alcohol dehydrogenase-like predicted oxidoreductase
MIFRRFGRLTWQVSQIGFGAWALGSDWGPQNDADSGDALRQAIALGCNFIDTARAYGDGHSERQIARVLKERRSDRVYVATKVPPKTPGDWPPGPYDKIEDRYPAPYVRAEIEKSLRDLETDCIDLIQIHTWQRAWNQNPTVFEVLQRCREEGKVNGIGVSTPEHDQNAVIDLIRSGLIDSVQVIYNIFNQEAQEGLLQEAQKHDVAVIVRVALDEGSLTSKFAPDHAFAETDIRRNYFAGDRLARTVRRVEAIRKDLAEDGDNMTSVALRFALKPPPVSTVIPGIRNAEQARKNCLVGDQDPLSDQLELRLRKHYWRRAFWYQGK